MIKQVMHEKALPKQHTSILVRETTQKQNSLQVVKYATMYVPIYCLLMYSLEIPNSKLPFLYYSAGLKVNDYKMI